jgi:hypothetical protein
MVMPPLLLRAGGKFVAALMAPLAAGEVDLVITQSVVAVSGVLRFADFPRGMMLKCTMLPRSSRLQAACGF